MASDGDSPEFGPSPSKKPKTDSHSPSASESCSESDGKSHITPDGPSGSKSDSEPEYIIRGGRKIRNGDIADEEYQRQLVNLYYQSRRSEGFEINWDQFDFLFGMKPIEWALDDLGDEMSNDELVQMLTLSAIDEHNKEKRTNLAFVEDVKANYRLCHRYNFWITFWAKDESFPNPESKLYQTEVWYCFNELEVSKFRPRPQMKRLLPFMCLLPHLSIMIQTNLPRFSIEGLQEAQD